MRTRLAKPSGDPPLEVDLGLRPEGRSGAIVRTIESFDRYYRKWGEPWEMQALLRAAFFAGDEEVGQRDRKSTRLNSSHVAISYAVFCLKKKNDTEARE